MTKQARGARCRWCGGALADRRGPGRPRQFCRAACRQAAYRARQLAAGHGLGDDEVVVRVEALEALGDAQYVLVAALEDLEVDLAGTPTKADLAAALGHLQEACAPLAGLRIQAVTDR